MGELFVTAADIKGLNIRKDIETALLENTQKKQNQVQHIYNLCNNLVNLLNVSMVSEYTDEKSTRFGLAQRTSFSKTGFYIYNQEKRKMVQRANYKRIMEYASILLFEIRTLFTEEEIDFDLGASTPEGILMRKTIHQRDLFSFENKNIRASMSSQAIVFANGINNLMKEDSGATAMIQAPNDDFSKLWYQIISESNLHQRKEIIESILQDNNNLKEGEKFSWPKGLSEVTMTWQYQRTKKGKIILNKNKKARVSLQYFYQNQYFNEGWLYQWFEELSHAEQKKVMSKIEQNNILGSLIENFNFKRDNVEAIRGGDFSYTNENGKFQPVQVKYQNSQILSFQQVITAIFNIRNVLGKFLDSNSLSTGVLQTANQIGAIFEENGIVQGANKYYNKVYENILKILQT